MPSKKKSSSAKESSASKETEATESAISVALTNARLDAHVAIAARHKVIRRTAFVLHHGFTCGMVTALFYLVRNLRHTEPETIVGYTGLDWWVEQLFAVAGLGVLTLRRIIRGPSNKNLERLLAEGERKSKAKKRG